MSIYTENQKTVTLKLKRSDVCDILLALTCCKKTSEADKWRALHELVLEQLDKHDEQQKGAER